jgi:hypothetical protein
MRIDEILSRGDEPVFQRRGKLAVVGTVGSGSSARQGVQSKSGAGIAGLVGAGAEAFTVARTGFADVAAAAFGSRAIQHIRTGFADVAAFCSGAKSVTHAKAGFAVAGTEAFGTSASITQETGFADIAAVGSGSSASARQAYIKSGFSRCVPASAGTRATERTRRGYAIAALIASGHRTSVITKAGYAILEGTGSGVRNISIESAGHGIVGTFGSGDSTSFASTPPQGILEPPMPTGQNKGRNNSRALATSRAASRATSLSRHQMRARARTHAHASSDTSSQSEGEAEAYVTRYEWLPGFYTLEEQLHRLTGEILNQPPRECFVKIDESKPYRARTADLEPAFRSAAFRDLMLPLFLENAARNSRYLIPAAQADAEIAARLAALNEPPSPDETNFAEPERADDNFVDAPFRSASRFHERLSDLGRGLRLVDGGKKDVHK